VTPLVSIILPTFNRLKCLRSSIESVFAQTHTDWELVIADDGSDEETHEYLKAIEVEPRVKVIRLSHSGSPSAVRNVALREAQGRYVAFLDSDDVWLPIKLEAQLAAHASCPSRRWSYTGLHRIDGEGAILTPWPNGPWVPYDGAVFELLLKVEAIVAAPSVLAERSLVIDAGGFDEQLPFFEDYDMWMRLSLLSDVIVVDQPLVLVRVHHEHYSADRIRVYESRFRLLDKHASSANTPHLRAVLRVERAKNAAYLALVSAAPSRRAEALKLLWRSREYALHHRKWWPMAGVTIVRALAPVSLRAAVRRYRAVSHRTSR
jgi:glycosyltransferase involved in cell wall biosynthesis